MSRRPRYGWREGYVVWVNGPVSLSPSNGIVRLSVGGLNKHDFDRIRDLRKGIESVHRIAKVLARFVVWNAYVVPPFTWPASAPADDPTPDEIDRGLS